MKTRSQAIVRRPPAARLLLLVTIGLLVVACGTPNRAPVVSREPGLQTGSQRPAFYQVRPGDTLYAIAWQTGLDYRELAAWNGISNPSLIHAGQRLRLWPAQHRRPAAGKPPPAVEPKPDTTRPEATQVTPVPRAAAPKPAVARAKAPVAKPEPVAAEASGGPLAWQWPTSGRVVERFSSQDRTRNGVKIAGRRGQPILAAEAGRIVYSGSGLIGYGQLIIIKHNKNYLSAYGHNRKILVKEGDQVARGAHIGEMGEPPNDQPLLHFEIRRRGTPVDPLQLLPKQG